MSSPGFFSGGVHGRFFCRETKAAARQLNAPYAWQCMFVPGARHSDKQMSEAAMQELLARWQTATRPVSRDW
jgi:hypothetical protein